MADDLKGIARGGNTRFNQLVGDTRTPISDALTQDDTLQRFYASFAPGGEPFRPQVPNLDRLEAPMGDKPPIYYGLHRQRFDAQPGRPAQADMLDHALARSAFPEVFQQAPEFAIGAQKQEDPKLGFWESLKLGFKSETLAGIFYEHEKLKSEAMALPGELSPVEGYDALRHDGERIKKAGFENQSWAFRTSRSPNETTFRIWQFEQRKKDTELLQRADGLGVMLGGLLDPVMLLPIVGQQAAVTKGVWGTFWRGARAASINAAYSLANEGIKHEFDPSYEGGGILDAIEIPAAIGFAVGIIHARTAKHSPTFNPKRPKAGGMDDTVPPANGGGGGGIADGGTPKVDGAANVQAPFTPDDILKTAPPHPSESVSGGANLTGTAGIQAGSKIDDLLAKEAEADGIPRSASSAGVRSSATAASEAAGEGLKPTGTGIEKWGITPTIRLLNSAVLRAREIVSELVDLGGLKQVKNMGPFGAPTSVPLEAEIARIWKPRAIEALHDMQQAWLEARGVMSETMGGTAWQGMKMQTRDWLMREQGLTWAEFDKRVAMAMRRGDMDPVRDGYSAAVNKAAASVRRFHDELHAAGMDPNVDIFGKANRRMLDKLNKEIAALKAKGLDSTQAEGRLQNAIDHINKTGTQSTALSYFTRYWNVDALMSGKDTFLSKVENYFVRSGVQRDAARKSALDVYETLTRSQMRTIDEEADDFAAHAHDPMSAKMRSLEIPDTEIEEFLESSATLSIRHQLATFAPAIEMTRRFGDTSLQRTIDNVRAEYKTLHEAAKAKADAPLMQQLVRQEKQDVEDILTLRDRLLNVAGASNDPHSWDQRTIRLLKHYMTWTTMGLSAFSQLGDLARPAITEGLDAMHRYGFATLISDSRNTIMQMAERERFLAGDSLEVVLASKAMAAADIGDVFASRSNFERKAGQFTNAFYMLNGMNHAVDLTKTWASVIVQSNINDAILKWGNHILDPVANAAPDKLMMERLKSLSIDGNDALRMAKQLSGKGIEFKSVHLANTEAWDDLPTRDLYRQALQRALQRTVVTPGLGDKPTWMSTPMGSLVGQFKSFGMSSTIRTLYAGLQDKDKNFFQGAAVLVGAGIVLNEIRAQLFTDRSNFDQPYLGILMDGVDRSGVLGSFTDINNALEAASNNKLGARPVMGAGKTYPVTADRLANAFLGPSAGKAALAADMLGNIVQGDHTVKAMSQARQFVPGQNWAPVKLAEHLLPGSSE